MIVDKNSTLEYLKIKITDNLEHFPEYNNIHGLKVTNLRKKSDKGFIILQQGEIKDMLNDGDTVYCDIQTTEYWIPTKVKIENSFQVIRAKFDMKVNLEAPLETMKYTLLKSLLNFFKEKLLPNYTGFHYVVNEGIIEVVNTDEKVKICLSDNPMDIVKYRNNKVKNNKDIFDFTTKLGCYLKFTTIEELIFDELKGMRYNSLETELNEPQKFSWNEFRTLEFSDLIYNLKFINETKVVKRMVGKHFQRSYYDQEIFHYGYDVCNRESFSGDEFVSLNINQ
jgi:hypothetical protein